MKASEFDPILFKDCDTDFNIDEPKFEGAGRVHDWRNYVPIEWQLQWQLFTDREKLIIAVIADAAADKEEWD